MTEHIDKDTLKAELANALHCDWCGCDAWDGVACEGYHDGEFGEAADAALTVVRPLVDRLTRERDEAQALADIRLRGLQDALAVNSDFQKVGRKRLGLPWHCPSDLDAALEALQAQLSSRPDIPADADTRLEDLGFAWTVEERNAILDEVRSWLAPVSGSDTTAEDVPDSEFVAPADPDHPAWSAPVRRMQPWPPVFSGGGTDTTEVPGER